MRSHHRKTGVYRDLVRWVQGAKMKQYITQDAAMALFREVTKARKGFVTTQELMNAAIQHYIDQRAKELPVLPEPDRLTSNCAVPWHSDELIKAYGQQCAAHAREVALEEAKLLSDTRAKAWWIAHSATNRHMDTTRKAHDDFCGLSVAIEALKGK